MTPIPNPSKVQRFIFSSFAGEEKESHAVVPDIPPAIVQEQVIAASPAPEMPLITEEQLHTARELAKKEGLEQGYARGVAEAESRIVQETRTREEKIQETLSSIANRIVIAAELQSAHHSEQQKMTTRLVMAIARKITDDLFRHHPYSGVESLLSQCNALIAGETRIVIKVPSGLYEGVKQHLAAVPTLLSGFKGELEIVEDTQMLESDCVVEWKNGTAGRDTAALWQEIETLMNATPLGES